MPLEVKFDLCDVMEKGCVSVAEKKRLGAAYWTGVCYSSNNDTGAESSIWRGKHV